jgi:hypothetical protein
LPLREAKNWYGENMRDRHDPSSLDAAVARYLENRVIRLALLARNHGGPCTNVLLGISADRRGRNGNDDPARPR